MHQSDEILEPKDLEQYGIKLNTVYSLVRERRIPHIRFGPRFIRFKKKEILEWINQHQVSCEEKSKKSQNKNFKERE